MLIVLKFEDQVGISSLDPWLELPSYDEGATRVGIDTSSSLAVYPVAQISLDTTDTPRGC